MGPTLTYPAYSMFLIKVCQIVIQKVSNMVQLQVDLELFNHDI